MKLLDHIIRSKARTKRPDGLDEQDLRAPTVSSSASSFVPNPTAHIPAELLEIILGYSCPQDDNCQSCEDSMLDGGCILCDLSDLAHSALVNKQWSHAATNVMYHHIRIDAVHYCDQDNDLGRKRNRRSFNLRKGTNPSSAPQERLKSLARTVRENGFLAKKVQFLKLPYMTREGSIADLARTVSFLPNLLYVDLPDGVYSDDPSCDTLKQELQSRCPKIRYMWYNAGSESSFQTLATASHWRELEAIKLSNLVLDPSMMVNVLASLKALRDLQIVNMPLLTDSIFACASDMGDCLPPLTVLTLHDSPNISSEGLLTYLSRPGPQRSLTSITLRNTAVSVPNLSQVLSAAPHLRYLHIATTVSRAFPWAQFPPLTSSSLQTLHYEILSPETSSSLPSPPLGSYFAYLSSSVLSGFLPSLTHLYALPITAQELLEPDLRPGLSAHRYGARPPPLTLGVKRPLRLYTKTISEHEWDLTLVSPPSPAHHGGSTTTVVGPENLRHSMALSPRYGDSSRQSVIVGNGFGGFLTVPSPGFAPDSSETKAQKHDSNAWMG